MQTDANPSCKNRISPDDLRLITAFAFKRTYRKEDAEDLAQEIVLELLASYNRLRQPEAYRGWMWAVARNTYKRWLRSSNRRRGEVEDAGFGPGMINLADSAPTPDSLITDREELSKLRREIGLLTKAYRDTVILYYVKEKSCTEIGQILGMSTTMVKQVLFKARKIMKEGMSMIREYGEKSYNPSDFTIYFWGDNSRDIFKLFERRLPGNILLSVIKNPLPIKRISIETGVPSAYLEDELTILESNGLIRRTTKQEFQTDIVVLSKTVIQRLEALYRQAASELSSYLKEELIGKDVVVGTANPIHSNSDKMKWDWLWSQTVVHEAVDRLNPQPTAPLLKPGNRGWVWGTESKYSSWRWGKTGKRDTERNWIYLWDYSFLKTKNQSSIDSQRLALLCRMRGEGVSEDSLTDGDKETVSFLIAHGFASNKGGRLVSEIPTFTNEEWKACLKDLEPVIQEAYQRIGNLLPDVRDILDVQVPPHLRNQSGYIAYLELMSNITGMMMETLHTEGLLPVPPEPFRNAYSHWIILK